LTQRLLIWGASSHALVVADIVRIRGEYDVAGFLDDVEPGRAGERFCGATILGGAEQLDLARRDGIAWLICAFGDGLARLRVSAVARASGFRLATAVHPRATVAADVVVGAGTVVAAGAVVNPGTRLGENVIVNTCASVDHECTIEDGAMVNAGARLAGRVRVGRAASVEIGAVVTGRRQVGAGAVVGAGSVVLDDVPDGMLAYGTPARVVRPIRRSDALPTAGRQRTRP
jgi:UDP-N-acetylbacillosamine N-acetyltransferase